MVQCAVEISTDMFVAGFSGSLPATMTTLKRNDTVFDKNAVFRFPKVRGSFNDFSTLNNPLEIPSSWNFQAKGQVGGGFQVELAINNGSNWEILGTVDILNTTNPFSLFLDQPFKTFPSDSYKIRLRGKSLSATNLASNLDIEFFTTHWVIGETA